MTVAKAVFTLKTMSAFKVKVHTYIVINLKVCVKQGIVMVFS